MPENAPFPFQVGEPAEHRGIVVAPLFPTRDPVARYATLDDALARGFESTESGPDGAVPELAAQLARGHCSRGYGRRRAERELRRRRLGEADVAAALEAAYGDVDEIVLARAALGSRTTGDPKTERRAVAFLVRRGFSAGAAWAVVRERRDRA